MTVVLIVLVLAALLLAGWKWRERHITTPFARVERTPTLQAKALEYRTAQARELTLCYDSLLERHTALWSSYHDLNDRYSEALDEIEIVRAQLELARF